MPTTVRPGNYNAEAFNYRYRAADGALSLLEQTNAAERMKVKNGHIIQSSFLHITGDTNIHGAHHGFVNGVLTAYNKHHHLQIRPDDVWISILSQLKIYINKNSEELRDKFIDHKDQIEIKIDTAADPDLHGSGMFGLDWGKISVKMTRLMNNHIKDDRFRNWISPHFSTTTQIDQATAAIMMMSTMQKYHTNTFEVRCGLPSVLLLGQKADWERLVILAEELSTLGEEPAQWCSLLKPILARFVKSFDDPYANETREFWQNICHYSGGRGVGATWLSGWITAFSFWGSEGQCFFKPENMLRPLDPEMPEWQHNIYPPYLQLDEAIFHRIETTDLPPGWASAPVTLITPDRQEVPCTLVAGSVGIQVLTSGQPIIGTDQTLWDTIGIVGGWWMYQAFTEDEKRIQAEEAARERAHSAYFGSQMKPEYQNGDMKHGNGYHGGDTNPVPGYNGGIKYY